MAYPYRARHFLVVDLNLPIKCQTYGPNFRGNSSFCKVNIKQNCVSFSNKLFREQAEHLEIIKQTIATVALIVFLSSLTMVFRPKIGMLKIQNFEMKLF